MKSNNNIRCIKSDGNDFTIDSNYNYNVSKFASGYD